jgi:serine-type D-Ala-D-Ala carboxypeptidase (penicillin-binding protein 5/6)
VRQHRSRRLQEAGVRRLAALAATAAVLLLPAASARADAPPAPDARAWLVVDARDGKRLAAHDDAARLPIASTTKLMTAYLALHHLRLSERLTAPAYHPILGESLMGLQPGERDTVHDLLYGMLLPSGNDAAVTLADGVAGSVPAFVAMMNRAAARLGLTETHYATPVGLDSPGNYSSAHDLVKLTEILRRNALFRRIVDTKRKTVRSGAEVRRLVNTNELLGTVPYVTGVKTGTTLDARHVLVSSATRHGVTLVAALLGAPSDETRDVGSLELLKYGFSRYLPRRPLESGKPATRVAVRYEAHPLSLLPGRTVKVWARRDQEVGVHVDAPASVTGPIPAGTRIGTATVSLEGRRQATVALRSRRPIVAPVIAGGAGLGVAGGISDGLAALVGIAGVALGLFGLERLRTRVV